MLIRRMLPVLPVLGLVVGIPVLAVEKVGPRGAVARVPSLEAGAKTYASKCASCHGKDAKGNPMMAKMLKVDAAAVNLVGQATLAKSDAELTKLTREGIRKMPSYKATLTDAQLSDLIAYLRSLSKSEPAR